MVSPSIWLRYVLTKFEYSLSHSYKRYVGGQITKKEAKDVVWKTLLQGRLTFLHWNKGEEMAPTIGPSGGTLLVRKLIALDTSTTLPRLSQSEEASNSMAVFVGDVVVLKDPENPNDYLVRRLAALEGYEMASKDEKDEPFVLGKDECWVLADNENLKPKEAKDSRTFGPLSTQDIIGRVIYCLRTAVDHGPVQNSQFSMRMDSPVLEVELDVDELTRNHKA